MVRGRGQLFGAARSPFGALAAWRSVGGNVKRMVVVAAVLAAIWVGTPVASAGTCAPTITPGESISRVVADCPGSTTFTIRDGSYKLSGPINVSSGDVFKGIYSDGTRPTIDANGIEIAFQVGGTNRVRIHGLDIFGADGGNGCAPACGKAIGGEGTNLHVTNVRTHHNANQGIGNPGDGFVLENSEIDHNGSYAFTEMDRESRSEPSSAAGIKILNSGTFRNNKIHHNYWNGIWCDREGGPIVVTGNTLYANGKTGIQYETCRGPSVIKNNVVAHNGYVRPSYRTARTGILLQDPQGVEISYNSVRDHPEHGIYAVSGTRQRIEGVTIHQNRLINDTLKGCQLSGISCRSN